MTYGLYAWPMADRPGRPEAKYRQIADHFRAAIAGAEYRPGDQLPSQSVLEKDFEASMGTVVRALEELRREGLVETRHGAGTFVLEPPEPSAEYVTLMRQLDGLSDQVRRLRERVDRIEARQGRPAGP